MSAPATVPEALLATAGRSVGEYLFHLEDGVASFSCAELAERAGRGAQCLLALGVEPGDTVGVLGPNRPEWVVWAFATWFAGAVLVPVQLPLRIRDPEAYVEQLRSVVGAAGCRRVLAEPGLAAALPDGLAMSWEEGGERSAADPVLPTPEDAAVIQFSSGSTAAPKGARLTHRAVAAQMELLREAYEREDGSSRRLVNWTPFFHDLGLFPNLIRPAFSGATIHQLPTDRFARDPAEWLRLIERTGAAITAGPASAYGSALRALERRGEKPDLGSLEAAYFGAEPVDPGVAERLVASAPDLNLDPEALGAAYGLAEAVMAASYTAPGAGLHFDRVSLAQLTGAGVAAPADGEEPVRMIATCGSPRTDLRIVGPQGGELPERRVGEIQLQGSSLMSGYVGEEAPDPFRGGWLCTGDLGYLADGELFVTGRAKDVIIAMGSNYYPDDFEWAAGRVEGVRPGRCIAFAKPETEEVVILVEARDGAPDDLGSRVKRTVAASVGIGPSEVVVLPPGTLEKTTSGKLRRAAMREAYSSGQLIDR
ncbi:MAG TPA: AMP-binding protein [Solirubrobacterales bacterium]|nr:AMP-binding protein [Solirubrobacterales bacterium]